MRFPPRIVFTAPVIGLLLTASWAEAGKLSLPPQFGQPPALHRVLARALGTAGALRTAALTCSLGRGGPAEFHNPFVVPPDDEYYILLRPSRCVECSAPSSSAHLGAAYISMYFPKACSIPVDVSIVGAVTSGTCSTPNPSRVICPVIRVNASSPVDSADVLVTIPLPDTCKITGDAFLDVVFVQDGVGCDALNTRPQLYFYSPQLCPFPPCDCAQCESYNVYPTGTLDTLIDLCKRYTFFDPFGMPIMYVGVDSCTTPDAVPPAAVANLASESVTTSSVGLTWSAPGDDGAVGLATAYDLRRATFALDAGNFATGDLLPDPPVPDSSGWTEHYVAAGLAEGTSYYFALKTLDEVGNPSAISNVLNVSTANIAPGPIESLRAPAATDHSVTLAWTATGDDGGSGRPAVYLIRASTQAMDSTSFDAAPIQRTVSASADAGGSETAVIDGLERAQGYWFAIKARDAAGNLSYLSNVIEARTDVGGPLSGRVGAAVVSRLQPSRIPVELYWQGAARVGGSQSLRIYDLGGSLRRVLPLGAAPNGIVTWDGRDDDGRTVPAGLYFVRLASGSAHSEARLVLLR